MLRNTLSYAIWLSMAAVVSAQTPAAPAQPGGRSGAPAGTFFASTMMKRSLLGCASGSVRVLSKRGTIGSFLEFTSGVTRRPP